MNKSTQTNPWHLLITASMLLLSAWMLTGCSEPELFEECVRDEECAEDEICLNLLCQPPQCDTDEIACGRDCVNPRIELEFCGGCNGCPGTDNAEGIQCLEGQCIYRCLDGFVDVNDDINDPNGDGCECVPDGPEVCDGVDNDCDGLVDAMDDDLEPCDAEDGTEAACIAGACELACSPGLVDVNEDLGTGGNGCECEPTGDEICDGIDNDCDGLTDTEDDDLEVGEEVCDGQDNDCDGDIDEDDDDFVAPQCQLTVGVCEGLSAACNDGMVAECSEDQFEQHAQSNDTRYQAVETLCDDVDNDCNGQVDEGCCSADEALERILTSEDAALQLVDVISNGQATQAAAVVIKETNLGVVLFGEDRRLSFSNLNLGTVNEHKAVSIHQEPGRTGYRLVYQTGTTLRSRVVNEDGSLGRTVADDVEHEFRELRSIGVSEERYLVVGQTAEPSVITMLFNSSGNMLTQRAFTPNEVLFLGDMSRLEAVNVNAYELVISQVSSGPFNTGGSHDLIRARISIFSDALTFDILQVIERPVFDRLGGNSRQTFLDGRRVYHIRQEDAAPLLGYTDLDNTVNFTVLFPLDDGIEHGIIRVQHVSHAGRYFIVNLDSPVGISTTIYDTEEDFSRVSDLAPLNSPHEKKAVLLNTGLMLLINTLELDESSSLLLATLNEEGDLRCP